MANQTSKRGAELGNKRAEKEIRRDEQIGFRATEGERQQLEAAAADAGLKLSAWVRACCGLTP